MPVQCTPSDIEIALEFLHCRVYDQGDLKEIDIVAKVGAAVVLGWIALVLSCSCRIALKEPVVNEYLVAGVQDYPSPSEVDGHRSSPSRLKYESKEFFNYYQGYRKVFKYSNKKNPLALVLFLALVSFAVSV
jgi:hypothetical protein